MLSKSLIQFSADGQGCIPLLLSDLRSNYGGGKEDNGNLLQKVLFLGGHKLDRHAAAAAKSLQSCPTLCDPIDGSPPGSPISGILQAKTLEWAAISFSNA